jgi:hypothetical protein
VASNRRYRELVPPDVQQFEAELGVEPADWYIPSAANSGVYLESLEEMFPEPQPASMTPAADHEG